MRRIHNDSIASAPVMTSAMLSFISDRGKGKKGNAVFYRDVSQPGNTFAPIVAEIGDDSYGVVDNVGDKFLIFTDHKAPNGRVFLFDPKIRMRKTGKTSFRRNQNRSTTSASVGGKLFVTYLKDVASRAYVYSLDGKLENEIKLPGLGTVGGFNGRWDDNVYVLYVLPRSTSRRRSTSMTSRRRRRRLFRQPEIPGFKSGRTMRQRKFSTTAKTARGCRCSSCTRRASSSTAIIRRLLYGYGGFQRDQLAGLQFAAIGAARAGRHLRFGKHARRRRVWRAMA